MSITTELNGDLLTESGLILLLESETGADGKNDGNIGGGGGPVLIFQSIDTFSANPAIGSAGGNAVLSAIASSGLPVSFDTSTPMVCTVTGNIVHFNTSGVAVLRAYQSGNANYHEASPVYLVMQVNSSQKQSQTITMSYSLPPMVGRTSEVIATASSGLPVMVANVGGDLYTVSGNTLTFLRAGTGMLHLVQAGDDTYASASVWFDIIVATSGDGKNDGNIGGGGAKISQTLVGFSASPSPAIVGHQASMSVIATGNSGEPIITTSLTPDICTINSQNGVISLLAIGECQLTAYQLGNNQYEQSPLVSYYLQVVNDQIVTPPPPPPPLPPPPSITPTEHDTIVNLMDGLGNSNGTYYDDNGHRCTVLDEFGNQYVMISTLDVPASASIVPLFDKDGGLYGRYVNGVVLIDAGTGIQASFYYGNGNLVTLPGITLINTVTLERINSTLPLSHSGYVIHWYSLFVEPPVLLQHIGGFESVVGMRGPTITYDYQSNRVKKKVQSNKFTFTFVAKAAVNLHVAAVRLLKMLPDGSMAYINDNGSGYSTGAASSHNVPMSSLYFSDVDFRFSTLLLHGTIRHKVIITYPNVVNVSAIEVAIHGHGDVTPDNVALSFTDPYGREYQAAHITGFIFNPDDGETMVLRLSLHDYYSDAIYAGPDITVYNEQNDIKAKIVTRNPLTLQEYMTLWLPRSDAVKLVKAIAAGKSAKDITKANKALTTRDYNMAVGATLTTSV